MRINTSKPAEQRDQWISVTCNSADVTDVLADLAHLRARATLVGTNGTTPTLDRLEAALQAFHDRPDNRELARRLPA